MSPAVSNRRSLVAVAALALGALALALAVGALATSAANAASPARFGPLAQLQGRLGCLGGQPADGCGPARTLTGATALALSPDGRNAYVASFDRDAVDVLRRDARTGALSQLSGRAGCVSESGHGGCWGGLALAGPAAVAVSPDGRNVYMATSVSNSVVSFQRSPSGGGHLRQIGGRGGCLRADQHGCGPGRSLSGADGIAVSPDGRNVYVASFDSESITAFARNPGNGALTELPGLTGCVQEKGRDGCADGHGLAGASAVTVSPDGRNVYLASFRTGGVVALARDPSGGAIAQLPGATGCVSRSGVEGCARGRALTGASAIAISPDGRSVYVAAFDSNGVAVLSRNPTSGALGQAGGRAGCVAAHGSGGCTPARGVGGPSGVAMDPSGRGVYVASSVSGALTLLTRNAFTGALSPLRGNGACLGGPISGCPRIRGIVNALAVAAGPEGRTAYLVSSDQGAVAVLGRDEPRPPRRGQHRGAPGHHRSRR